MMHNDLRIEDFQGRLICIGGVGKMFYQEGFPISMAVSELKKLNVEVSILHAADECLKNGWSAKTTFRKLKADFEEDIDNSSKDIDWCELELFCSLSNDPIWSNGGYETQREMIFKYLFQHSSNYYKENREERKHLLRFLIK